MSPGTNRAGQEKKSLQAARKSPFRGGTTEDSTQACTAPSATPSRAQMPAILSPRESEVSLLVEGSE